MAQPYVSQPYLSPAQRPARLLLSSLALCSSLSLLSLTLYPQGALARERGGEEAEATAGASAGVEAKPTAEPSEPAAALDPSLPQAEEKPPSPPKPAQLTYPHPTEEEVAHEPPLLGDLLRLRPIEDDKRRCQAQKGRWRTFNKQLHGCVVSSAREGRWHIKAEGEPITLLAEFTQDKLNGLYIELYESGRARAQGRWSKGKKEGRWLNWYPGGQLESLVTYEQGKQHGRYFSWFDTCLPQEWGAFKEGERHGPWRTWYMTGARQQEGRYEMGRQEGRWSLYHSEGNKIEEGEMRGGLKEGDWQEWLHTGQPWRTARYAEDLRQGEDPEACRALGGVWEVDYKERVERCVYQEMTVIAELRYYPSGALQRRLPYSEAGQHSGLDRRYHEEGALLSEGRYVRGVPQGSHRSLKVSGEEFARVTIEDGSGLWVSYHPNGAIAELGRYLGGVKVGVWRLFHDHVKGASQPITDPELALSSPNPAGLKEELLFTQDGLLSGPYLSLYEDGTLSIKGSFEDGSRAGTWQFNYQNGQPALRGDFQFGVRMGPWREWHWMASPKVEGQFQFNRKDGAWREYHNNGKLKAEGGYKRGERDGLWRFYWYSGEPWRELRYRNGVAEDEESARCEQLRGTWSEDLKGRNAGCQVCRVSAEGTPKMLKLGRWRWWHPNGKLQTEGHFESGERHGLWRQFDESEQRTLEGRYRHDQQVDEWRGFHSSGELKFIGGYHPQPQPEGSKREAHGGELPLKEGLEDGVWYTFYESGALESVGRYLKGSRLGLWAWWTEAGELSQVGAYLEGKREGVWASWHSGGGLRDIGAYQKGARRGPWRWWRKGGEPWRGHWYGPAKQKASLPLPAPRSTGEALEELRAQLMTSYKGVSAQASAELKARRAPELSRPLELPPLSAETRAALEALGAQEAPHASPAAPAEASAPHGSPD